MFQGRVVSRSNLNEKVHTIQKDFDNYDDYRSFLGENPDYLSRAYMGDWWSPWSQWDPLLPDYAIGATPTDTHYFPESVDFFKYEKCHGKAEKREKKHYLESNREYLINYLNENANSKEAKKDLEQIEQEIKNIT